MLLKFRFYHHLFDIFSLEWFKIKKQSETGVTKMSHINKYLRNFKPYSVASHAIWSYQPNKRDNVLKLDWNESTQDPSPLVKERLLKLINDGHFFNLYPMTYNKELLTLISNYVGVPIENVQYFGSSDSLHEYIAKLYITVGDPVLILGPSYDNFRLTVEVSGGVVHFFEYSADFSFDENAFLSTIDTIKPSLVYICNPNNPTGHLHDPSFIESLLKKYPDIMFLIDEAYYEFAGDNATCAKLAPKYDNILISRTMSKAFGLANFRFGYLIADSDNIKYISTIRNPKNITTFAQVAATAVLEDIPYMKRYVNDVVEARTYFISSVNSIKGLKAYESSANFVLVKCGSHDVKESIINHLAKHQIYVRDTEQSQIVHCCFRVTIGEKDQMVVVVNALKQYFLNNEHE
jgi:histidinol-phosphate aminotransferase